MRTKRRAAKGQGTLYQRPGGRWSGQLTTGDGRRKTVSGGSQAEVISKLRALRQQLASGLPVPDERLTVARFLAMWVRAAERGVRPATLRHYQHMARLIEAEIGEHKVARLSPTDVATMLARLADRGLSPQTCALVRAALRNALGNAQSEGLVSRNVAALARAPLVKHQPPRILTPDQTHALLEVITEPGLRRLAALAVHTGLRQGEELGLRWLDVDRTGPELHVMNALQRIGDSYQLVEVKSASSRRTVPLTGVAVEALEAERRAQLETQLAAGGRWREPIPGLVFTTRTGQPRSGSGVTHAFAAALRVAGLPPMHWHHLRHAFAGLALASGVDLATVSALLGHSSVNLTASTYAGVMPSTKRQATDRLERLLGGGAKED